MKSPCIKVCKTAPDTGFCIGCFRTIDEIRLWTKMTEIQKLNIMYILEKRRAEETQKKQECYNPISEGYSVQTKDSEV